MLADTAIDLFTRGGAAYAARWGHILVGITWIGLLYFFNFVQTPAFAEMEPGARNNAMDKITWRTLWWFRWAAAATFAFGILLLLLQKDASGDAQLFSADYFKSPQGMSILTGALLGTTMFVNVWAIIWQKQKIVIANARNVQAGGEPDPAAAAEGRKAALASRQNVIYSFPMLVFMVGTAHFPYQVFAVSGGKRALYWIITLVIWALFELNALGYLGGTGTGGTRTVYDTHQNSIWTGSIYAVVLLLVYMYVLAS